MMQLFHLFARDYALGGGPVIKRYGLLPSGCYNHIDELSY